MLRRFFYQFVPGVASGLGTGAERMGLLKPQTDPLYQPVPYYRAVKGDLGPLRGALMVTSQMGPTVSLQGSGAQLTGALALQALAQFDAQKQ